ncbi:hypothetical protein [Arcticibacterium luteifluviistationis]|uniref:Uncharacterized protein n=1 Tax=Arcticibacterium luteifluviistationis TaxID=1784714 RepID=A0A2Z4GAW0_9BACT|nr:hypothetical protein [Arcticibacterium luteifluviistationis]AWV98073.1 hypothetical protein DJ013_07760 [Arcticibacterium luteifluviistationis]
MGVFGEVLVVVGVVDDKNDTYFPKKDLIFGLDISLGKVLWKTQTAENYEVNNINGLHYGLKPYKEGTIVRALGGNHYFELDTQNGRIQATSLQEQLTLLGLKYLQSSDISSTHLFFKSESSQGHGLDNCIGSFNYETKKIDWHHVIDELSETGTTIKNGEPKASANKIYALDTNNTLHIFERVL